MLGSGVIVLAMVFHLCRSFPPPKDSCQPLQMSYCQKLGYNKTIFPNNRGHRVQGVAVTEASRFSPLVTLKCSPDVAFFFCMVYFPVCTVLNKPIPPCRSVCLSVRSACEPLMKKFSFTWPKSLNCNKFPDVGTSQLCVSRNQSSSTSSSSSVVPVNQTRVKKLPLKQRYKFCRSATSTSKSCCNRGKKAAKRNLSTCSLVNLRNRPRKGRFLRKAIRNCTGNKVAKECYKSCCEYRKREQRNKRRKQKKARRRRP